MLLRPCQLLVVTAVLLQAGCTPAGTPAQSVAPLVWPAAPEPARIAFVRAFASPSDLGIDRSLLERLGDVIFGGDEQRLVRPMDVVVVDGTLYVADPGAAGVHRFDTRAGRYDLIQRADGRALPSPVALAAGPDGGVYVSDSALAAVFRIGPRDEHATALSLSVPLGRPTGITWNAGGNELFVVDTAAHRVQVFDRDGRLVRGFGQRGNGDGEFNFPTRLWRSAAGELYVTDSLNFRVQILDASGRFIGRFGNHGDGTGDAARQKGVATDSHGHVYVTDALFNAVQIFDRDGRLLLVVGTQGQQRGEFWLPGGLFIDADDTLYVADTYNRRVQVFRYVGGPT